MFYYAFITIFIFSVMIVIVVPLLPSKGMLFVEVRTWQVHKCIFKTKSWASP